MIKAGSMAFIYNINDMEPRSLKIFKRFISLAGP